MRAALLMLALGLAACDPKPLPDPWGATCVAYSYRTTGGKPECLLWKMHMPRPVE